MNYEPCDRCGEDVSEMEDYCDVCGKEIEEGD